MSIMTRDELRRTVDRMESRGGFAGRIGQAALLADDDNLKRLVNAFPELFAGQALENQWTQQLSTSKTVRTANLKLVWS